MCSENLTIGIPMVTDDGKLPKYVGSLTNKYVFKCVLSCYFLYYHLFLFCALGVTCRFSTSYVKAL